MKLYNFNDYPILKTNHKILFDKSEIALESIKENSVDLMVTSPPYPMINLWDIQFSEDNPIIKEALSNLSGEDMFQHMHLSLYKVWTQVYRVLKEGGIACINIGDATRTIGKRFRVYPNYARILQSVSEIGFEILPGILWRKPTNSPNKFMGSGMLPGGAYVTLEHEHIIVLRKGDKKKYSSPEDKANRRRSAYFWEERNKWFSDLWEFKGTSQKINKPDFRKRSTAFPLELPYRLINMYSSYEDTVLDPFLGTGTTSVAAAICGRNSVGIEMENSACDIIKESMLSSGPESNRLINIRIKNHNDFVKEYTRNKGRPLHFNDNLKVPVITSQEKDIQFYIIDKTNIDENLNTQVEYVQYK